MASTAIPSSTIKATNEPFVDMSVSSGIHKTELTMIDTVQTAVFHPQDGAPRKEAYTEQRPTSFPSLQDIPPGFARMPPPSNFVFATESSFYLDTAKHPPLPPRQYPMLPLYAQQYPPSGYTAPAPHDSYYRVSSDPLRNVRPAQFLYYNQVPPTNGPQPYVSWSTQGANMQYTPLLRQRSAKACNKCRKRKTKCCGGFPCTRCRNRGFECEYEGAPSVRGKRKDDLPEPVLGSASSTSSSDGSRSSPKSSRGEHRHQPYPPSSPRMHHGPLKMEPQDDSAPIPDAKQPSSTSNNIPAKAPSVADSLGLKHLQAALEVAIEMDRANHMQNSSFVVGVKPVPLEIGMEMSSMVETVSVSVPWVKPTEFEPPSTKALSQESSEEGPRDAFNASGVQEDKTNASERLPKVESHLETADNAPCHKASSPSPSALLPEFSSTSSPSSELTAPIDGYIFSSTLTISELNYIVGQDPEAHYDASDLPLLHSENHLTPEVLSKLAAALNDDTSSSTHFGLPLTLKSCVTVTPSSSSIVLNFDEYINFSPDAKGSPVRTTMSITRSMSGIIVGQNTGQWGGIYAPE